MSDPLRQLDANALVSLDFLLQERSVTRAAGRAGVTQSAMSQTLRRLRAMLDDPLLVRSGSRLVPTPRAAQLKQPLHEHLTALAQLVSEPPSFSPAKARGDVRLAVTDYAASLLVPHLVERLAHEAPGLDVVTQSPSPSLVFEQLRSGQLDMFLGVLPRPLSGVSRAHLWQDRFVVLVRKGHALLRSRNKLSAYVRARHLLVSPTGSKRGHVDDLLAAMGHERRVAATVPYFLAAPAIVAASDLVLTLPERIAARFAQLHDVAISRAPIDTGSFDATMAWPAQLDHDPASRWLREQVHSVVDES